MKPEVADALPVPSRGDFGTPPGLAFALPESKFHPPTVRPGIVVRTALVERLAAARVPVITAVAPPGYGKTTLLAQWAERTGSRIAWLSCDDADNDPVVLLSALAVALSRIGPVHPAIFSALASSGADITGVPRFVATVASVPPPVTVLLDHAEAVTNKQCLNTIAELALHLPPGWQLALASRTVVPLPTARLRAQGGILEVTADDLAMGPAEARSLLKGAGVEADETSLRDLLQRTEGWPAGLYIAALAIKSGTRESDAGFTFTGDDVYMGDYLRSELLARISAAEASFLSRTSVLDRMCGSLCDAILEETGSGTVLEHMEARNLLVIPLDRRREWYRYHHLLRDLLRSELHRQEPGLVQGLHFRAAAWFEANAMPEQAIGHVRAAGDYDRVARLILEMFGLLGQPSEAERWAAAAERASSAGILPDGSTMEATLAYLRAILCRKGTSEMRHDAQIAWDGLSPASPYRATMLYTEGISFLLEGDPARAAPILARALNLATHSGSLPLASLILAEQCDVAAERDDWPDVTKLAGQAAAIVENGHFRDYWTSALVYAWASRAATHRGDISQARFYLGRASRLRPLLTYALPVVSVQALLEMTRSYIALGDPMGAAAVLAQAHEILQQRPDLGLLSELAGQLHASLATGSTRANGASSLTAAELRLLPLLSTHLSYAEIGERLYVSKNTVKTQAYSAYRKLGVSSRSEAVVRTRELGLDAL